MSDEAPRPAGDGPSAEPPAAASRAPELEGPQLEGPQLEGPQLEGPQLKGPDLARAALARARAAAREKGLQPGAPRARRRADAPRSGSGPDGRDPVLFGTMVKRLVAERGWEDTTAAAGVLANWERLVGPEIADHCRPTALTGGVLELVAESSAWATQLRLLTLTMTRRLAEQVGEGVVTSITVRGPAQADWRKGPRRVQGRGPRDTYG